MSQCSAELEELLSKEIARIRRPEVAALAQALRVQPRVEDRPWSYGAPGQTFPCWVVLEYPPSNIAIAYCAQGFGPQCPWGLLSMSTDRSMGDDSGWFVTLEETVMNCYAWEGEDYSDYELK